MTNLNQLSRYWKSAPRRWGHPLHSLCSYFAMFPPQIPHVLIGWLTEPGDVVYDPFAGRGTAPMEACRLGRVGLGSDANPLAHVLTSAKVNPPTPDEAAARIEVLRNTCSLGDPAHAPDSIRMLYHPRVLGQLLWLREEIQVTSRADCFIMALLLGVMHANYLPGRPVRGLSISMPNTFSMSPGYVQRYIKENLLVPPEVDVFDLLEKKLSRMDLPGVEAVRGKAWQQDARDPVSDRLLSAPAKLVFTSPPYLSVISYGKYNWIRLWMLKQEPKEVDANLMATSSLTKYLAFMKIVLENVQHTVREDGYVCLVIGDVREKSNGKVTNLAECVWDKVASTLGWFRVGIVTDRLPTEHKVSRIWNRTRGHATKTDRILILCRQMLEPTQLPKLRPTKWSTPTAWA
jgi:hypothetical protein